MSQPIPAFFSHLEEITARLKDKELFLFLDYDGTLTPIVDTPDLAVISDEMREMVIRSAAAHMTAIVSGRATDDVRSKVRVDGIYYAGSHGFEIVGPDGNVHQNPQAAQIRESVKTIHAELSDRLAGVKGALVEDVKYTISVHYRLVAETDFHKIEEAVTDTLERYPDFRRTSGKKVFEVRPKIDWDKGKAVEWIFDELQFDSTQHIAVYIGDDTTDEDAFAVLKGKGFGILVADCAKESLAEYQVRDTPEVKKVLEFLAT
ncbi:MAG: trehalose-phosphatase [Candidatus Omnitrophica bacterium]|nr:trehalose-phosphatase [Candidatus Omnitrophota bacterium]MCB9719589.1 trehalose-phosphatase [Candidatus Omnitrophota bacterium]